MDCIFISWFISYINNMLNIKKNLNKLLFDFIKNLAVTGSFIHIQLVYENYDSEYVV